MDCPRCRMPLSPVTYEGVETDMCNTCWGFWLDCGELEQILDSQELQFSQEERDKVLGLNAASRPGSTEPAACPKCGKEMARVHCDESIHLVIDQCEQHGVWLDTGEIKKVQALAEKSDDVRRMMIRKLGLG